jgi:23S rRNA (cytosine1962-C5)-methyltransferase
VLHGWSPSWVEADRYGDTLVVEIAREAEADQLDAVLAAADARFRADRVILRSRTAPIVTRAIRGEMPTAPLVVHEHGVRYLVEPGRPGNPGLYLDARAARGWILANAAGRRVLNLFAFTGSLGVAAAVGGARSLLHIDANPSALAWCRANHELNGVPIDDRSVARMNLYQHLRKNKAARQRYGAIILDPPPGPETPRPGDRTPGERGPLALIPHVARMLEPGGWLLVFLHHGIRTAADGERDIVAAAAGVGVALEPTWRGTSGDDFPEEDATRKLQLVAFTRSGG